MKESLNEKFKQFFNDSCILKLKKQYLCKFLFFKRMNKKELTERDICTKFINPALVKAGWNIQSQILEEVYFTDGKIHVKGKITTRGKKKRADYILFYKPNIPIAIIEAKDQHE